jgi:sterol desaturase/sphingolipid hydroxylase (fatty acid hydroxylase superfamily)
MLSSILGFLSAPVTTWIEGKNSREFMKSQGALEVTKAKIALEIAEMQGKADRLKLNDKVDADYDKAAQMERRHTLADEFLIFFVVLLVSLHFIIPGKMAAGWLAMGYENPPWWLEFIIVGIFVSVFGLMRLFRAFNPFNKEVKRP